MFLLSVIATNVTDSVRKDYLHAVLHQSITFHETVFTSGAFSLALSTHSNAIRSGFAEKFGLSLKCISTIIAAFAVAIHSQWKLALVTATVIPAAVLAIGITGAIDEKKEQDLNSVKAEAATAAEEVLSSIRTVRALGAEGKLSARYNALLNQATAVAWSRLPIVGAQVGSYMFALYGAYALAFWYGMHLYARHEAASSGAVITALFSIMIGVNAFSELATHFSAFAKVRSAGEELFKIIDAVSYERHRSNRINQMSDESQTDTEKSLDLFHQDIQLQEVCFCYPTRPDIQALKNFDLKIPAGKTTALVGPSGSGKSTIVGLLLGWYQVSTGTIKFGNSSVADLSVQKIRANIGLVQQVCPKWL
jgi:ATP-binding cassette subfamily B (MDR/TAP) protein 1